MNSIKYKGHNNHGGDIMPNRPDDDIKIYIPKGKELKLGFELVKSKTMVSEF